MTKADYVKPATEATRPPSWHVRPVHVEFWRCGNGKRSGWTKCPTNELCRNHGCQKMQMDEIKARGRVSPDA